MMLVICSRFSLVRCQFGMLHTTVEQLSSNLLGAVIEQHAPALQKPLDATEFFKPVSHVRCKFFFTNKVTQATVATVNVATILSAW